MLKNVFIYLSSNGRTTEHGTNATMDMDIQTSETKTTTKQRAAKHFTSWNSP